MDAAVTLVVDGGSKLISLLWDVKRTKEHNIIIAAEVELFVRSLTENIDRVEKMQPNKSLSWALESLEAELNKASAEVENALKKGFIMSLWDSKTTQTKLAGLRQDLANAFHLYLFISTLKVSLEGAQNIKNFESTMLKLSALSAAHSDTATTEIKDLLRPILAGMRKQDERVQSIIRMVRNDERDSSHEIQKFIADVMSNLESLPDGSGTSRHRVEASSSAADDDQEFYDPIKCELMCDPVKCKDGLSYDRWTIIEYNITCKVSKVIVCDDVNLRKRLFKRFPRENLEEKCRNLRKSFREQALYLAKRGHHGEALTMLKHVLEWDESDTECQELLQRMQDERTSQDSTAHTIPEQISPPPSIQRITNVSNTPPDVIDFHSVSERTQESGQFPKPNDESQRQSQNPSQESSQIAPLQQKNWAFVENHPWCFTISAFLLCPCLLIPICCFNCCKGCLKSFKSGFVEGYDKQIARA